MSERAALRSASLVHALHVSLTAGLPLDRVFDAHTQYAQVPRVTDLVRAPLLWAVAWFLDGACIVVRHPGEPRGPVGLLTRLPPLAHHVLAFLGTDSYGYRAAAYRAATELRQGFGLAHVMERWMAPYLSDGMAAAIAAGDRAGQLAAVLPMVAAGVDDRLTDVPYRHMAKGYIAIYGAVGFTLISGMMTFIVPKFAKMFDEMLAGEPLPMLTNVIISLSNFVLNSLSLIILFLPLAVTLVVLYMLVPPLRQALDSVLCSVPWLGRPWRWRHRREMAAGLANCVASGLDLHQGALLLADCRVGWWSCHRLADFADAVRRGIPWDQAWLAGGERNLICRSLIATGAYRQDPAQALRAVSDYYGLRLRLIRRWYWDLLRPAATLFFGLIVGTVVLGMLLPLIKLIDSLAGM